MVKSLSLLVLAAAAVLPAYALDPNACAVCLDPLVLGLFLFFFIFGLDL